MNPITDPAWFYSSLAQSAASIVGVVGAVFLARLGDHRAWVLVERERLADELRQYGQTFETNAANYVDQAFLARQAPPLTPGDVQALSEGAGALSGLTGRVEPKRMAAIELTIEQTAKKCEQQAPDAWARSVLLRDAEDVGRLRRKVELFRARALPSTLIAVWALLAWLTIFGVIWPLTVLPALPQMSVSKCLILTLFGIGILGFVVFLAYELWQFRQLGQFDWKKR